MEEVTSTPAAEAVESGAPGTTDQASVTDGGTTQETATPATQDAGTAEESVTAASEESTTARQERRQRQREARKQAAAPADQPAPEPVKSREEIAAEIRAQDAADARAAAAQQQEAMRYARYFGDDPVDPKDPSGPTRYQKALADSQIRIPTGDDKFFTDEVRELAVKRDAALVDLERFNEKRQLFQDVRTPAQQAALFQTRTDVGNELEALIAAKGLPAAEIIASVKDPNKALHTVFNDVFARLEAAKDAEYRPQIEDLEDDLAAKDSEIDALRRQLGGAAPQALRGGVAAGVGGALTYERYASMDPTERMRLRSTPEGRAQIDAMTQGRTGAA